MTGIPGETLAKFRGLSKPNAGQGGEEEFYNNLLFIWISCAVSRPRFSPFIAAITSPTKPLEVQDLRAVRHRNPGECRAAMTPPDQNTQEKT